MSKYLILLAITFPTCIQADKLNNPYLNTAVYNQIKRARPAIDSRYALELTESIYKVARAFKIDARLLTAILAQESMFNAKAFNATSKDYGLAQINHKTAKAYKFDLKKLKRDPCYSVWAAGRVLNDFKKVHGKERAWWTRYNSSKPENRSKYKQLVARYM